MRATCAVRGSRAAVVSLVHLSNSPTDVIHRPRKSSGAGRRLHFLPPSKEGAERRSALRLGLAPLRGAACCCQHARLPALHLWRFSSRAALPGNRTDELSLRLDPGGRSCPTVHPGHVQPSKAAPSRDGAGGDPRRPGALVCIQPETRAPHLAPPHDAS